MGDINIAGRDEYHQHIRDIASTDDMHGEAGPYSEEPEPGVLELPEQEAAAVHAVPLTPIPASPLPVPAMSQDVAGLLLPPAALSPEGAPPSELGSSPRSPGTLPRSPNLAPTSSSSRASSPTPDTPPPPTGFWKRLAKGGKGTGKSSKREKMADAVSVLLERTASRSSAPSEYFQQSCCDILLTGRT